ncbi:hypothetical protein BBO99_00008937 [Phytophthora kernoviae]|uniref:Uncharacterized protein n=2 Tax=Phytophthora kernoviae TaxID=325452 RepID=A0A3R7KPS0_9STRA|nr:hypothetical protein G195_010542 [Phytophthora kernoviae 00238/432]KAG2509804.1 hypothetical protein JM18_009051 [Phytophthora kernoviae]RLN02912.1 hypothetical protein BBI17_009025 [Phytophthora kernoviae]RLN74434.1 hypothetical protein BBO99_00008937 [Phytophthora kernoviae]
MVEFRLKKKEQKQQLNNERRRLERQLKLIITAVKNDNGALRAAVAQYEKLKGVVLNEQQLVLEKNDSTVLPLDKQPGWWVHFSDNEPSFFFHPLSQPDFNAVPNPCDPDFASSFLPADVFAARLFGWEVYRSPLTQDVLQNKSTLLRVRFSKRLRCSLDAASVVSRAQEQELCPILATPIGWGTERRHKVSMQLVQEIGPDVRVLVHNIPGQPSIRYLYLARRARWKLPGDIRKTCFSMVIFDSEANKRSRDSEPSQGVDWVTEGGGYFTLTEIDENAIEVICEQWVSCESKLHAEYVMIQWTQFLVQWEQAILPSNLLK